MGRCGHFRIPTITIYDGSATMHDVLSLFKRNINQLFGITVDILNVGRSLQQLSLSMQILANNGVVQAAKIPRRKGRPMLALVEILNNTLRKSARRWPR